MCGTYAFIGTPSGIRLDAELRSGRFRFGPLIVVTKAHGCICEAPAMRWREGAGARYGSPLLRFWPRCVHVKEHGESQADGPGSAAAGRCADLNQSSLAGLT